MLLFSPAAVNVQFMSPVTYSVSEGSSVNVIAILNVASTQDLTVDFDTMPGSATCKQRVMGIVTRI